MVCGVVSTGRINQRCAEPRRNMLTLGHEIDQEPFYGISMPSASSCLGKSLPYCGEGTSIFVVEDGLGRLIQEFRMPPF
jgi:hypothetical protein